MYNNENRKKMSLIKYLLLFSFISILNLTHAQIKHYDFNILAYGGIGFGVMENDTDPNYNLNSNSSKVLLKYRVTHRLGIATGIGMNELSGSGFNASGNFHHQRMMIKIPLVAILDYPITDHFSVVPNLGVYAQNIIKDEYRFLNDKYKNIYDGWNMGAQLGVGLLFQITKGISAGFNYSLQLDITKFSSTDNLLTIDNKQKLGKLNTVGMVLVMEL